MHAILYIACILDKGNAFMVACVAELVNGIAEELMQWGASRVVCRF